MEGGHWLVLPQQGLGVLWKNNQEYITELEKPLDGFQKRFTNNNKSDIINYFYTQDK
jgi:hypothetical protein